MKVAFSYFLMKVPAIFTEGWTKKLIKIKQQRAKAINPLPLIACKCTKCLKIKVIIFG